MFEKRLSTAFCSASYEPGSQKTWGLSQHRFFSGATVCLDAAGVAPSTLCLPAFSLPKAASRLFANVRLQLPLQPPVGVTLPLHTVGMTVGALSWAQVVGTFQSRDHVSEEEVGALTGQAAPQGHVPPNGREPGRSACFSL